MHARDRLKYVSRKVLRWFGGIFLALGVAFAVAAAVLGEALSAGIVGWLLAGSLAAIAVATRLGSSRLAAVADVIVAIYATLIGVLRGMAGQTMTTWAPAKSR
jgi:hypothetical protein